MKYIDKFQAERFYHVFNHAVGDEVLFRDEDNYIYFLNKFGYYIFPVAKTFAYCLMPNHFHFFIQFRTAAEIIKHYKLLNEEEDDVRVVSFDFHKFLMQQFSNFLNSYTKSYNKVFKRKGALLLDYTRRVEIFHPQYFKNIVCYINNNPVKHGFCKHPSQWKFSSYSSLIQTAHPSKIERATLREWFADSCSIEQEHLKNQAIGDDYAME